MGHGISRKFFAFFAPSRIMSGDTFTAKTLDSDEDAKSWFGVQALACAEWHSLKPVLQTYNDLVAAFRTR